MIALICGKREEGKSTRAISLALAYSPRVIILDHRSQFELGTIVHTPDELWEALDETNGIVVYQLFLDVGAKASEEIEQVIEVVRQVWLRGREHNPESRFTFIVDEAGELSKHGSMGLALHRMIRQIRLDTVQVLLLCHRPMDISTSFRSLITDMYLFNTTDQNDLEWLREAGVPESDIEEVQDLPRFHHIHVVMRTRQKQSEKFEKPEAWRVDWEGNHAVNA